MVKQKKQEMTEITDFVCAYRQKYDVTPKTQPRSSLSGEGFGEAYVTLYQELIPTREGYGVWNALEDEAVRKMVLGQVRKDQNVLRR